MLSLTSARQTLEQLGYKKEVVDKFILLSEPHIEFHKYIMKRKDISSETCETLIKELTQKYVSEKSSENSTQQELFEMAGKAIEEFAISEDYDKKLSSNLNTSIVDIAILFTNL